MDERIAGYIREAENATDAELLIRIEANTGQAEIRGACIAERERRQNDRQEKLLAGQLRLSKASVVTAICAAIVAAIGAAATVVQAFVAYMGTK